MLVRFLLVFLLLQSANAEYRVGLIIGDPSETKAVASSLSEYGYRCEETSILNEKELRRKIEGWSRRTPTNSRALIYFTGEVKMDKYNGDEAVCLMATGDRPIAVAQVFEYLTERGGSRKNVFIAAGSRGRPKLKIELAEGCSFFYAEAGSTMRARVTGTASKAISPPDRFVPGRKAGDEWVNPLGMVFCWCPPGKYTAGSPVGTPGRFDNEDQREVVIKEGFWIGKYELTDSQLLRNRSLRSIATQKNHPVNMLHWDDGSRMVVRTLTEQQRKAGHLPEGWQYHLPSEDQWEYAARAGTTTRFYFGENLEELPKHANFADKSYYDSGDIYSNSAHRTLDDGFVKLAPVGSFKANPWGLHDVYGNVVEWCRDQAARGGGWVSLGDNCRSAYRDRYSSRDEQTYLGYRIVIQPNVPEPAKKK